MIRAVSIVALVFVVGVVVVRITQPAPDPRPLNGDAVSPDVAGTAGTRDDAQAVDRPPTGLPERAQAATVTSITDGDTLRVDVDGTNEPVRLLELDAPEVTGDCGASEATEALRALAPVGSRLWMEADVEGRDRYGRLLRYLYRSDGTMINEAIVRDGWAHAKLYPPNDRHWSLMQRAQREAQDHSANLWARCGWTAAADETGRAESAEPTATATRLGACTSQTTRRTNTCSILVSFEEQVDDLRQMALP